MPVFEEFEKMHRSTSSVKDKPQTHSGPNAASGPEATSPVIVRHIEPRPVEQLVANANNVRRHSKVQIGQIAASIREFGFVNPILIGADNVVIAGHARLEAGRKLGMPELPVIVLANLSEAQRRALAIADNQLPLNAAWDEEMLRAELAALTKNDFDLELLGFGEKELARLVAGQQKAQELLDPDAVPELPEAAVTAPGDLWVLGEHRLLCGDATRRDAIDTILGAENVADMVFTDASWEVANLRQSTQDRLLIDGDRRKLTAFLGMVCRHLIAVCSGAIYVCMSSANLATLCEAFQNVGGFCGASLIWVDQRSAPVPSDYQSQYTPILYGWRLDGSRYWSGARNQGDVWFIPRPSAHQGQPIIQPVELVERPIENSSRIGGTVLDVLAGSGTTLIACARKNRRARLIELDPRYVDMICKRWQQFSGEAAMLESDGGSFEEVARQREKARRPVLSTYRPDTATILIPQAKPHWYD